MKKFIIAMLCVAVLFGFAACDNSGESPVSGTIASALVSGGGEKVYLPGETVDLSDYTFTLVMDDGTTQPANAADFVFDDLVVKSFTADKDNKDITGTYKGINATEVTLTVNIGKVTGIKLSGEASVDEYYAPTTSATNKYKDDLIDLVGLTVTATYVDEDGVKGERELALDNKYLQKTMYADNDAASDAEYITPWAVDVAGTSDNFVVVYFNEKAVAAQTTGKVDSGITALANIPNDSFDVTVIKNLITKLELKTTEGYEVIKGSASKGKLVYTSTPKTAAGVYVEATYQNEETEVLSSGVKFSNDNGTSYSVEISSIGTVTIPDSSFTLKAQVTLSGNGVEGLVAKIERQIAVVENSVTGISASIASGKLALADYTSTMPVGLTVTTVLRDGSNGTALDYGTGYTVSRAGGLDFRAQNGYEAGQNVTFTVTAVNGNYTDDVTVTLGN